jgi:hypothetical protein
MNTTPIWAIVTATFAIIVPTSRWGALRMYKLTKVSTKYGARRQARLISGARLAKLVTSSMPIALS